MKLLVFLACAGMAVLAVPAGAEPPAKGDRVQKAAVACPKANPEPKATNHVDSSNNGLTTVAERFKQEAIAGHVILTKGERSPLAELATQIL